MEDNWKKLVDHLKSKSPGLIEKTEETDELEILVWHCWHEFKVIDQREMERPKFPHKMRGVSWVTPILKFEIKKHGPYVDGSIEEVVQDWELNVETKGASCLEHPPRKAWPMDHEETHEDYKDYKDYSERVAEQVVEAIHSGQSLDLGLQVVLENLIKRGENICEGVSNVFPISELPTWDEGARQELKKGICPWASLSDIVSEKRLKKLCNGGRPTPEELLHVAREEVNSRLEESAYSVYGAYLYCLVGSDGRKVWGVAYQQDDVIEEFEGPFLTREEALEAIAKFGFTDPEQVTINHVSAMLPKTRRKRK